jgi:BirA family transcriptional regulator, biotin operon repressor / biotin---[acetyl-CoA-carboxylase] ligase
VDKTTIGKNIIHLDSVDSTNIYAIDLLKNHVVDDGTVINTSFQSQGKGYIENHWESEKDKNLTFSIILYPEFIELKNQFILSKAISLGIVSFLNLYLDDVYIKWPNDIYISDKKIAGILIENFVMDNKYNKAIVGIGVNINQTVFISVAPNPVSLKNITGINYDVKESFQLLLKFIENNYNRIKTYDGISNTNREYIDRLYKYNVFADYEANTRRFKAKITGVDDFGKLMMIDEKNNSLVFGLKEVKFL